jgi:CheY-like chemotaxis protein
MPGTPLKVLVVEDDDDNRELLGEFLRFEGYTVEAVGDAERALVLASDSFDAVVADVGLPGMDGLTLARELRRRFPRLAVVAVSGWGDGQDLADACGREIDAVVVKPAEPARLLEAISSAVRARRAMGLTP